MGDVGEMGDYMGDVGEMGYTGDSDSLGFTQVHLGSLGLTWVHLVSLGFTWVPFGSLGFNWFHLGSLGLTWVHLGSLGFTGAHLGSLQLTWVHLGSLRFTCVHFGSLGFTWVHMGSLGFTWGHLGSLGFPLVDLGDLVLPVQCLNAFPDHYLTVDNLEDPTNSKTCSIDSQSVLRTEEQFRKCLVSHQSKKTNNSGICRSATFPKPAKKIRFQFQQLNLAGQTYFYKLNFPFFFSKRHKVSLLSFQVRVAPGFSRVC